jgi:Tol biopolymer transport system component
MTSFDRFERSIPALLEDLAVPRLPDYADDLFARTAATRQRPGWTFPERWLPLSAISRRLAVAPRVPWRLGVVVALLAVAALIAVLIAGAFSKPQPAPFGPAANGLIAFQDAQGRILLGDPATGLTRTLVAEPGERSDPLFSQDGGRLFYLEHRAGGTVDLMVASVDGSSFLKLNPTPIADPRYGSWSAHGDRFLLVNAASQLLLYDASKTAEPRNLSAEFHIGGVSIGLGYNFRPTAGFRPPTGDEIAFATLETRPSLMAMKLDGTGVRTLIDGANPPVPYHDLKGAEWSPDGSKVLVLLNQGTADREAWHLFVMKADGSDLQPVGSVSKSPRGDVNSPLWSPDGARIAFQYWTWHANDDGEDFHALGVIDLATGRMNNIGQMHTNGYVSWQWSPDGTSILELPGDEAGGNNCSGVTCTAAQGGPIFIVNATTGRVTQTPWSADTPINWQRVAPRS